MSHWSLGRHNNVNNQKYKAMITENIICQALCEILQIMTTDPHKTYTKQFKELLKAI